MKKYAYLFLILIAIACEDVIDIDIPQEEPRLIIDALIRIDPNVVFGQRIGVQVNETSGFFGEIPATNLKQITLGGLVLQDTANPGSGLYENWISHIDDQYRYEEDVFQVQHKDQRYLARAIYQDSSPIESLSQGQGNTFNDDTEIIISFKDDPDAENFYLFDFDQNNYMVSSDKFYNGQNYEFSYKFNKKIEPGTKITVSIMGIDRSFFNYMGILINQTKEQTDLFETPVSTLRGNIINVTEIDNIDYFDNVYQTNNFALGYFALAETYTKTLVIK